ncbi:alpha/beta hydrolase fold [Clostridium sp. DSM 8431]|uniref:alpha/beta hydrolase n=1 Tax=Clostridium sp. DSM 8431 TaxID=1761781 RepID=UPI0008E1A5A6|nr:alpha/beta hydrolase [Clostridium sp. DSM 8431]SFU35399.1 alpha/beta hydrolase fold [Clostridium sp. DSM 8431]
MIEIYSNYPGFDKSKESQIPSITSYLIEDNKIHPAIIVLPGGGYEFLADHEGEPIAKWLNTLGINAFVLKYRIAPEYKHPSPLHDAQRAIRYVRYNAKEFNINAEKIGILGFSAGGHLAASASVFFDNGMVGPLDEIDKVSCRPDMSILCYPVINLQEYAHLGSRNNLIGEDAPEYLAAELSCEKQVKKDTPPAFIWTTAEDTTVPPENSMLYAKALKDRGIPFELHVFPKGHHGLGLTDEVPYVKRWANLCADWFKEMKFI